MGFKNYDSEAPPVMYISKVVPRMFLSLTATGVKAIMQSSCGPGTGNTCGPVGVDQFFVRNRHHLDEIDKVATMVEECGGLNRIHQLQHHKSEQDWHKCLSIMQTFFPDDDQMEEEIATMTTKADEVKKNKEHKGEKKASPAAPERNRGPGRGGGGHMFQG